MIIWMIIKWLIRNERLELKWVITWEINVLVNRRLDRVSDLKKNGTKQVKSEKCRFHSNEPEPGQLEWNPTLQRQQQWQQQQQQQQQHRGNMNETGALFRHSRRKTFKETVQSREKTYPIGPPYPISRFLASLNVFFTHPSRSMLFCIREATLVDFKCFYFSPNPDFNANRSFIIRYCCL